MYFNNYDIIFAHMFNSYSAVVFIGRWCLFHSVLTIATFIWGWYPLEGGVFSRKYGMLRSWYCLKVCSKQWRYFNPQWLRGKQHQIYVCFSISLWKCVTFSPRSKMVTPHTNRALNAKELSTTPNNSNSFKHYFYLSESAHWIDWQCLKWLFMQL